jgi:argininosuccinate synthase
MWRWTVAPEDAPNTPLEIELTFANGDITAIDGKP